MHGEGGESDGFYVLWRQNLSGQFNICMRALSKTEKKREMVFSFANGDVLKTTFIDLWIEMQRSCFGNDWRWLFFY